MRQFLCLHRFEDHQELILKDLGSPMYRDERGIRWSKGEMSYDSDAVVHVKTCRCGLRKVTITGAQGILSVPSEAIGVMIDSALKRRRDDELAEVLGTMEPKRYERIQALEEQVARLEAKLVDTTNELARHRTRTSASIENLDKRLRRREKKDMQ